MALANQNRGSRGWRAGAFALAVALVGRAGASEPLAFRVESLAVSPASQPLVFVAMKNLKDTPFQGRVALNAPHDWRLAEPKRQVSLAPGQVERISFPVERGVNAQANSYPLQVVATDAGTSVTHKQNVVCASAPYYKPKIDGDPGEWTDAIPVTFMTGGKKTVISTYWNRRRFSLLVMVEESKLIGSRQKGAFDAVQVAIAPQGTKTGTSANDTAARHEFLFAWTGAGSDAKGYLLIEPGTALAEATNPRCLAPLAFPQANVAVSRKARRTYYECSIPFRLMRERIPPSEGREFYLSVCVHDPDGTGVRDWGAAAGLWPWQRNHLAWCRWQGDRWGDTPPFDSKLEWGLCSSKY
jgi:hypothetical protein